ISVAGLSRSGRDGVGEDRLRNFRCAVLRVLCRTDAADGHNRDASSQRVDLDYCAPHAADHSSADRTRDDPCRVARFCPQLHARYAASDPGGIRQYQPGHAVLGPLSLGIPARIRTVGGARERRGFQQLCLPGPQYDALDQTRPYVSPLTRHLARPAWSMLLGAGARAGRTLTTVWRASTTNAWGLRSPHEATC